MISKTKIIILWLKINGVMMIFVIRVDNKIDFWQTTLVTILSG